jgi:hypothetical protein
MENVGAVPSIAGPKEVFLALTDLKVPCSTRDSG